MRENSVADIIFPRDEKYDQEAAGKILSFVQD